MGGSPSEDPVWLIAGPTASGKSALAVRVAERLGAAVVNADSMQVYADLHALSARPSAAELERAPHRLYGHVDGAEAYSVGRWLGEALAVLAEPGPKVVVGGTGLYFRALTVGLAEIPPVPEALRAEQAERFAAVGEAAFRAALAHVDPAAEARIAPADRQRLVRAAAVHAATGRSLSDWQAATRPPLTRYRALVLEPPRPLLYARCDARFEAMLAAGALEEARALLARDLPERQPVLRALGVQALGAHLRGEATLAEATAIAKTETRNYAKRQLSWFRNQNGAWPRLTGADADEQWGQFLALEAALTDASAHGTATSANQEQ